VVSKPLGTHPAVPGGVTWPQLLLSLVQGSWPAPID
jgi:hypothetical protein